MFIAHVLSGPDMKPSPQRTTVAALRVFLDTELKKRGDSGMMQKEFADKIGRLKPVSRSTIQKLESGELPLSESTAKEISEAFGVSLTWLLNGKPKARIMEAPGLYTKEDREKEAAEYWAADETPETKPTSIRPYSLQSYERASHKREEPFGLAAVSILIQFDILADSIRDLKKEWGKHPDGEFRLWKLRRAVEAVRNEFHAGS